MPPKGTRRTVSAGGTSTFVPRTRSPSVTPVSYRSPSVTPVRGRQGYSMVQSRSPSVTSGQFRGYLNYTPRMTNIGERNVKGMSQYSKYSRIDKARIFTDKTMTKKEAIDYFDAAKSTNLEHALPIPNSLGLATTLNFKKILTQSTSTAGDSFYYIFQFTPTQNFAVSFGMQSIPTLVQPLTFYNFDDLLSAGPTNIRNSRATIGLYNLTAANNVSGAVTIFSIPNSLEWEFDAAAVNPSVSIQFQTEIKAMLDSNPRSKTLSASMFVGNGAANRFSLIPSSMSKLEDWATFTDLTSVKATRQQALINGSTNFTHTTLVIRLDGTVTNSNIYNFVCNHQYSTRFPQNSILSSITKQQILPDAKKVETAAAVLGGDGAHLGSSTM